MSTPSKTPKSQILKSFALVLAVVLLSSHDLYLKMGTYFLQPNQEARISLYNGTFERSENIITRDRMLDASIVIGGERRAIQADQWQDQDSTITYFPFKTEGEGTYLVGVSTQAKNIELAADEFNDYLEHDGVLDMLEQRTQAGLLDQDAVESYQKHVKAIFQVGDAKTEGWKTVLDYPIEFVPQENPYEKYSGENLAIQLLLEGEPLANQLVYADFIQTAHSHEGQEHGHEHGESTHTHDDESGQEESHTHTSGQKLRTNNQGIVTVDLPEDGIYYIRTIHMVTTPESEELTHQSKWATLTFEVTHKHGADTHTHDDHDHEEGIPTWVFVLGSAILIGLFYLIFRKKD
ncbi:DUF4198 domain-containing protein [Algoriphagus formosus]|uniref:DUF4198 domain-containing protein n=1 Tax=Algoriphagus formosus TaxID=2007308 RepID=UPI003F6F7707